MLKSSFVSLILILCIFELGCAKPGVGPQQAAGANISNAPPSFAPNGQSGDGRPDQLPAHARISIFIKKPDTSVLEQSRFNSHLMEKHKNIAILLKNSFELYGSNFIVAMDENKADLVCSGKILNAKTTWPPFRVLRVLSSPFSIDDFCEWQFNVTAKRTGQNIYPQTFKFTVFAGADIVLPIDQMVKSVNKNEHKSR